MTKTLGQIAQEAFDAAPYNHAHGFNDQKASMFEHAAAAVRAAVIDECAQWLDDRDTYGENDPAASFARAIRALKDKQ